MCSAGARQRRNHPRCCPSRQPPSTHRGKARLRERRKKLQPPVDPAVVTPATAANLALGYPKPLRELAQQQGLFDGGEGPALRARQHTHNGFRHLTRPPLNKPSIPTKPAK